MIVCYVFWGLCVSGIVFAIFKMAQCVSDSNQANRRYLVASQEFNKLINKSVANFNNGRGEGNEL